jgi:hypothetical protein
LISKWSLIRTNRLALISKLSSSKESLYGDGHLPSKNWLGMSMKDLIRNCVTVAKDGAFAL